MLSIHLPLCCILILFCLLQNGNTALHFGAENGHLEVCELLLQAGALADAQNSVWESILNIHQVTVFSLSEYLYCQNSGVKIANKEMPSLASDVIDSEI